MGLQSREQLQSRAAAEQSREQLQSSCRAAAEQGEKSAVRWRGELTEGSTMTGREQKGGLVRYWSRKEASRLQKREASLLWTI